MIIWYASCKLNAIVKWLAKLSKDTTEINEKLLFPMTLFTSWMLSATHVLWALLWIASVHCMMWLATSDNLLDEPTCSKVPYNCSPVHQAPHDQTASKMSLCSRQTHDDTGDTFLVLAVSYYRTYNIPILFWYQTLKSLHSAKTKLLLAEHLPHFFGYIQYIPIVPLDKEYYQCEGSSWHATFPVCLRR